MCEQVKKEIEKNIMEIKQETIKKILKIAELINEVNRETNGLLHEVSKIYISSLGKLMIDKKDVDKIKQKNKL